MDYPNSTTVGKYILPPPQFTKKKCLITQIAKQWESLWESMVCPLFKEEITYGNVLMKNKKKLSKIEKLLNQHLLNKFGNGAIQEHSYTISAQLDE
jgi:hypothetical protein